MNYRHSKFGPEKNIVDRIVNEIRRKNSFKEISIESIDAWGEGLGKMLSKRLKTSQIRKIFGEFKKLHTEIKKEKEVSIREKALLLKPRLAYVAGRHPHAKPLTDVLSEGVKKVVDVKDYDKLFRFFEAILAYHKYYGGQD